MPKNSTLITTGQAAKAVGVSPGRIRQLIGDGKLAVTRVGAFNLIDPRDLKAVTFHRAKGRPRKSAKIPLA